MSPECLEVELARQIVAPPPLADGARDRARRHFIDTVGVVLAGTRERCVRAVVATVPDLGSTGEGVRSLVSAKAMSARDAALCNGVAGHAHDFDDDEPHVIVGHPSIPVVAALLATPAFGRLSFEKVLQAYAVGTETMLRIGALVNPRHYNAGWHCTASLGVMGAAAACAHAMSLSLTDTANALNLATTFSAGLKENFGTDGKPLQVGAAAANGLFACELSSHGLRVADATISGRQGFAAMNSGRTDHQVAASFGRPWGLETPGFNIKIYPCCSSTHTALDALLDILRRQSWRNDEIEHIEVWVGEDVPAILIHDIPETGLEGKFSMRYCIAQAAVNRAIGFDAFTDQATRRPEVASMMGRVSVRVDGRLPRASTGVTHQTRVVVHAIDGQRAELSYGLPIGSAERPCSEAQFQRKFIDCASHGLGERAAQRFWAILSGAGMGDSLATLLEATSEEARP